MFFGHGNGHGCCDSFKSLDHKMENQGDKLVITLSGDKEVIAKVEKKMKAMRELCECGEDSKC
jgi:hypothetical protein